MLRFRSTILILKVLGKQNSIKSVTVNGHAATLGGLHNDTAIIATGSERTFEEVGHYA